MRQLKIPYALDAEGRAVHAAAAAGGVDYTCPGCPRPIRRRRGDRRRQTHFYHPAGADHCALRNRETYYHIMGKLALQHLLAPWAGRGGTTLDGKVRCFVCSHHTPVRVELPRFAHVLTEERAAGSRRVPDLVLRDDAGEDVAYLEVKYRHAVGEAKAGELMAPWLEIDAEALVESGSLVILNGVAKDGRLALTNFSFCANPDCWVMATGNANERRTFQAITSQVRLDGPIIVPLREVLPSHHVPGESVYGLFAPRGKGYRLMWPNPSMKIHAVPFSWWGCDVDYFRVPAFNDMRVRFPDGSVKVLDGRTGAWSSMPPRLSAPMPPMEFFAGPAARPPIERQITGCSNPLPWPPPIPDDPPPRRHTLGKLPPTESTIRWVQCLADTGHLERPPLGPGVRATSREEALCLIETCDLPTRKQYRDDHAWWRYRRRELDSQRAAVTKEESVEHPAASRSRRLRSRWRN